MTSSDKALHFLFLFLSLLLCKYSYSTRMYTFDDEVLTLSMRKDSVKYR